MTVQTPTYGFDERLKMIGKLWQDNRWLYGIAGFAMGVIALPLLTRFNEFSGDLLGNLFAESLGIVFTVLIIDSIYRVRARNEREQALKERLIREARSSSNETAKAAIDELRANDWLEGDNGLLQGVDLWNANLEGAVMIGANLHSAVLNSANLHGVVLWCACLQDADLSSANLREAILNFANLQGVDLSRANLLDADLGDANLNNANLDVAYLHNANLSAAHLYDANLCSADLQDANLSIANLQGALLFGSNLQGANLENAQFNEETILPDSTQWTPDTDMNRFTDPEHPDFWRSDNPDSPAYRGDE